MRVETGGEAVKGADQSASLEIIDMNTSTTLGSKCFPDWPLMCSMAFVLGQAFL